MSVRRGGVIHRLWLGSAVAALLLAGVIRGAPAEGPPSAPLRVVFPTDECILESGKFELLCVMTDQKAAARPRLRVDGKPARWEPYEPPILVSRLQLPPGRHEILIGQVKLRVHVRGASGTPEPPSGWPVYRTHPANAGGWKDCSTCHEVGKRDGRLHVGDPREPDACAKCHSSTAFELAHFHPREPLSACHMCHALHGSTRPSLLKAPVKELCAECHD